MPLFNPPPIITVWTTFTPTGTWNTNVTYSGLWRRVGDTMEVQTGLVLTGAPNATNLNLNIPSGYTIDTSKFTGSSRAPLGYGQASAGQAYTFQIDNPAFSTTQVEPTYQNSSTGSLGSINATLPITWAAGNTLNFTYRVPIVGWTANT